MNVTENNCYPNAGSRNSYLIEAALNSYMDTLREERFQARARRNDTFAEELSELIGHVAAQHTRIKHANQQADR